MSMRFADDNPGSDVVACCPDWNTDDFVLYSIYKFLEGGEFAHIWCPHCEATQHVDLPASAWTIEAERQAAWSRETPIQAAVSEAVEEDFWLKEFGELNADIDAKKAVIEQLRAVVLKLNDKNVDLSERIAEMERIAAKTEADVNDRVLTVLEIINSSGSHHERNVAVIRATRSLVALNRMVSYDRARLNDAAAGRADDKPEMDDIPF